MTRQTGQGKSLSPQCLMELWVQSMQLIHKQTLLFCLKKHKETTRMVQWFKESNIDWQNELKPSFAILSTLWSAIEDKYYMWNQFVVTVMIWNTSSFCCQVFSGLCLSVCLLDLLQCTVWHWVLKTLAFILLWVTFSDCVPLLRQTFRGKCPKCLYYLVLLLLLSSEPRGGFAFSVEQDVSCTSYTAKSELTPGRVKSVTCL